MVIPTVLQLSMLELHSCRSGTICRPLTNRTVSHSPSLRLAFLGNCVDQSHPFVDSEWLSMSIMHAVELQLAAHVHC